MIKDCEWFWDNGPNEKGFCCKDLDAGRCWDCTAPNKKIRIKEGLKSAPDINCPYPKLGKKE